MLIFEHHYTSVIGPEKTILGRIHTMHKFYYLGDAAAVKAGMTTMLDDGLEKVLQGITTVEEVLRVIRS